jgi:hypothetical protein
MISLGIVPSLPNPVDWLKRFIQSLWVVITGSGHDALTDTLKTLLLRPNPDFSTKWFLEQYNSTFFVALIVAMIVQLWCVLRATTQGRPMGVIGAALGYIRVFLVSYCIPAAATIVIITVNDATNTIMWMFGTTAKVESFGKMLAINPLGGWQSMLYAFFNVILLVEASALTLIMYAIAILGPILYALGGLGRFGDRTKRLLWLGLIWPGSTMLVMVTILAFGNWLMAKLPAAFFATQGAGVFVANMVFIMLAMLSAPMLFFLTRKTLVSVENSLKGDFNTSGATGGMGPATPGTGTAAHAAITNRRSRAAGNLVKQVAEGTENKKVQALVTKIGGFAATKTPATAVAAAGTTLLLRKYHDHQEQKKDSKEPPVQRPPASPRVAPDTRPAAPKGENQ